MKKIFLITIACTASSFLFAQSSMDSANSSGITVQYDPRFDVLKKKEAQINDANSVLTTSRAARGYRLMLLNTNNKDLAIKIRAQLLQNFPDQKVYMSFQSPYIKLKFGDFLDKDAADEYKKEIIESKIITGNIYVVPDLIEIKPDKTKGDVASPTN